MIYVASSWRNLARTRATVHILRAAGLEVFDFSFGAEAFSSVGPTYRGMTAAQAFDAATTPVAFHWSEIDPGYGQWNAERYVRALSDPRAERGFATDFGAMKTCDTCVLVLPCGKSAHLELGWFAGQGKRTAILLDETPEPELMYKIADAVCPTMMELLAWLGVKD